MARGTSNYIPRPDGNFSAWANHYYEAVKKFYDAQGFDPTDLKPLETALENWNKDYPAHVAAQQRAEGARQAKDAARAALEKEVRPVTNFVQAWGGDDQRRPRRDGDHGTGHLPLADAGPDLAPAGDCGKRAETDAPPAAGGRVHAHAAREAARRRARRSLRRAHPPLSYGSPSNLVRVRRMIGLRRGESVA